MYLSLTLPNLEERFLPPNYWQTGDFINPETKHKIHYSFIKNETSKATVICLPGLSEFGEKYIETARFFTKNKYDIYIIDWAYQGRSTRFKENPNKRHSDGYDTDLSDLNYLIKNKISSKKHLFMLGHSMGGHIGLRYLATKDHDIKAASFSAPMIGIRSVKYFPDCFGFVFRLFTAKYVPGGKDWHENARSSDGKGIFSSDVKRDKIHNAWCLSNPQLQVGSPTFQWLYESLKSINFIKKKKVLKKIKIPVLLAYADKETLVDNSDIINTAKKIKKSCLLLLKNSKHEILMETNDIRDKFLTKTLEIFNQ